MEKVYNYKVSEEIILISKVVYKYIDESEKNIYESLLGARL